MGTEWVHDTNYSFSRNKRSEIKDRRNSVPALSSGNSDWSSRPAHQHRSSAAQTALCISDRRLTARQGLCEYRQWEHPSADKGGETSAVLQGSLPYSARWPKEKVNYMWPLASVAQTAAHTFFLQKCLEHPWNCWRRAQPCRCSLLAHSVQHLHEGFSVRGRAEHRSGATGIYLAWPSMLALHPPNKEKPSRTYNAVIK